MAIDPGPRALKRRFRELERARRSELDSESAGVLLFYAVENGLKALFMEHNRLENTSRRAADGISARAYGHDLERIGAALRIPRQYLTGSTGPFRGRDNAPIQRHEVHEAWRYGVRLHVDDEASARAWLEGLVRYIGERI